MMIEPNQVERALIGLSLLYSEIFDCLRRYPDNIFYDQTIREVFKIQKALHKSERGTGLAFVSDYIVHSQKNIDVAKVSKYPDTIAYQSELDLYLKEVLERYKIREFKRIALEVTPDMKYADIEQKQRQIEENSMLFDARNIYSFKDSVQEIIDDIVHEKIKIGLPSGYGWIDENQNGLNPGYYVVAARPSKGKTTLGFNIALNSLRLEKERKVSVGMFSAEMDRINIAENKLSCLTGINNMHIRKRVVSNRDKQEIVNKGEIIQSLNFVVNDTPNIDIEDLKKSARSMIKFHGVNIMLVDYIQLVRCREMRGMPKHERVEYISQELKALQREHNLILIALAQLNRGAEGIEPNYSHIKDCGTIEQDADFIYFIYDPPGEEYHEGNDVPMMIKAAKTRNGPVGKFRLWHKKDFSRFSEMKGA